MENNKPEVKGLRKKVTLRFAIASDLHYGQPETLFDEMTSTIVAQRAVFHGHEHDQDGVKMEGKLPFLFDSHVGGNWGTDYKGFRVVELLNNGTLITYMMKRPIGRLAPNKNIQRLFILGIFLIF